MQAVPPPSVADTLPRLTRGASLLAQRSHAAIAELAAACRSSMRPTTADWVASSSAAKGWQHLPASAGEEWASGPLPTARFLFLVQRLHERLARGLPPDPRPLHGPCDRVLLAGCRARIDAGPGPAMAPRRSGDVALVLGAGNVTATPCLDVLHQVFLCGRAALLKLSPLHRHLEPIVRQAFAPLVAADLLAVTCGDAALGRELTTTPGFGAVHLTGSLATWAALRAVPTASPRHLSAEVGNCTPVLVWPTTWRQRDLLRAARQIAIHVACNGGATCLAPRLLLTARGWPQRSTFLDLVRRELAALPARVPFHPGAREHHAAASGRPVEGEALPPSLRRDLDAERDAELVAREHFAPVLLEMPLPGDTVEAFAVRATAFVRETVFGSLAAYVFVPPRARHTDRAAIERTIEALPHGTIAVNCWAGLGYGLGDTPWGVPAGRPWQHGAGWTRGTTCLPDVRRVVVETPLRPIPRPPWLRPGDAGAAVLRALTHFHLAPSFRTFAATAAHALRYP